MTDTDARVAWWLNRLKSGRSDPTLKQRLQPEMDLEPELARLLPEGPAIVDVLDVMGGPLTNIGNRLPRRKINIVQLEAQADRMAEALEDAGYTSRGRLVAGEPGQANTLWPTPSFDLVVCRQAGLLPHPVDDLAALFSVLRPGGSLVVTMSFGPRPGSASWAMRLDAQGLVICLGEIEVPVNDLFGAEAARVSWQATSGEAEDAHGWLTITFTRHATRADRIRRELDDFTTSSTVLNTLYGVSLEPSDLDFVADFFSRKPDGTAGSILPNDAAFLLAWMKMLRPSRVLEIGVSSGVSSAFILEAAQWLGLLKSGFQLDALDLLDHVYAAPQDAVGWVVERLPAELTQRYNLITGVTSADLGALLDAGRIVTPDMVFLDAEHAHPSPAVDLERLCGVLPEGQWILLHDISLFERALRDYFRMDTRPDWMLRGVQWAFELYPGEKVRGAGEFANVGAIRALPDVVDTPAWKALRALPRERKLTHG